MGQACGGSSVDTNDMEEKHAEEPGSLASGHLRRSASSVRNWQDAMGNEANTQLYQEYQELLKGASVEFSDKVPGFRPGDCLLIVDMQNDFVPAADAPDGGRFGVAEGAAAAAVIVGMMKKASDAKALIIATRDYHPKDHCSFNTQTGPGGLGPFPPHCVQGTKGSWFLPIIGQTLEEVIAGGADARVVFKGFHRGADSFGGFTYGDKYFAERNLGHGCNTASGDQLHGCCALDWTGSFCLECSNIEEDINAPPDVMAVLERKPLKDELQKAGVKRLFVTGLALDFCVLDSALNASAARLASDGVFLVVDAARAAHIPGVGGFGSGFLSDPAEVVKKTKMQGVKIIHNTNIGT